MSTKEEKISYLPLRRLYPIGEKKSRGKKLMTNLPVTPITYKEAMTTLNVPYANIKEASEDGRLSRLPTMGQKLNVIKEQVELFKGKKQIRLTMLSPNELELWVQYEKISKNYNRVTSENTFTYEEVSKLIASIVQQITTMTEEEKKRLLKTSMIVLLVAIALALGVNWYLIHKNEITEQLAQVTNNIPTIDMQVSENIVKSLSKFNEHVDVTTVIETVLKEVA